MNRNAAMNLPWLSLLATCCFACSTILGAQQPSGTAGASSASMTRASSATGLYSIGSSGPDGESAAGLPSRTSSRLSSQTGTVNSRSARMAGANSTGRANAGMWTAGEGFRRKSGASWIAGADNFSLGRQQSGIWRLMPGSRVQPNAPIDSSNLSTPLGLTSKGAEVLKGARSSYSTSAFRHQASGIRGSGAGRVSNPFGAHAPSSGGFGNGIGIKSTQHTPSSTTNSDPPLLHDTQGSDGNLPSLDLLGSGTAGATGESSH